MSIAYLILAHKDAAHVGRLIGRLATASSRFYVHWDAKCRESTDAIRNLAGDANMSMVKDPASVYWGHFSQIVATLKLIEAALVDPANEYLCLISGQDYPLKAAAQIEEHILGGGDGRSFMYTWPMGPSQIDRINRWHFCVRGKWLRFPPKQSLTRCISRRFPAGIDPHCGHQWWCLHRSAAEAVVEAVRKNPKLWGWYRWSSCSDEMFFQTILLNAGWRDRIIHSPLTYTDFETGPEHPRVLTEQDWPALQRAPMLFARKMDMRRSAALLDRIDAQLLARPTTTTTPELAASVGR